MKSARSPYATSTSSLSFPPPLTGLTVHLTTALQENYIKLNPHKYTTSAVILIKEDKQSNGGFEHNQLEGFD